MAQANVPFDKRLKRIVRRHEKMANGVVKTVSVARPRLYKPRFPLQGLIIVLLLGFIFKGFLLSYLGDAGYADRLALLQQGSVMEQAGAWIMQPDPATVFFAQSIGNILP